MQVSEVASGVRCVVCGRKQQSGAIVYFIKLSHGGIIHVYSAIVFIDFNSVKVCEWMCT